jgi:Na+/proline symporter
MPTWLVPTLKWGGIALAIIAAIAIIYVQFIAAPAPPEATAATDEAPMTLYWIMLLVGVVAAIAGFVIGRRPGPTRAGLLTPAVRLASTPADPHHAAPARLRRRCRSDARPLPSNLGHLRFPQAPSVLIETT